MQYLPMYNAQQEYVSQPVTATCGLIHNMPTHTEHLHNSCRQHNQQKCAHSPACVAMTEVLHYKKYIWKQSSLTLPRQLYNENMR